MSFLVIDIGNTRLKWGLYEAPRPEAALIAQGAVFLEAIDRLAEEDWARLPAPQRMLGSAVAGQGVRRRAEERDSNERRVEQLCTLFEKNGVAFDRALLPDEETHLSLSLERDAAREEAFASALLGTAESSNSGGGVSRFTGEYGSCSIRSGGTADALLSRPVDDPESFSKQLFKTFGYQRRDTLTVSNHRILLQRRSFR